LKKSIILVLSLVLVILCVSYATAQENSGPSEDEAPRDENLGQTVPVDEARRLKQRVGPWWAFFSVQLGVVELDNDWKELDNDWRVPDHFYIKISNAAPPKGYKNVRLNWPPYFWAVELSRSQESDSDALESYNFTEIHFGLKQIKNINKLNLYWGGGLAATYARAETQDPNARFIGSDYGAGYWVHVGLNYLAGEMGNNVCLGLAISYSEVELRDWGNNGGGLYYGISMGYPFWETF